MNDVGDQAVQTEQLATTMLEQVYALLARHNIIPNAVQEQMLTSHVRAMAHRSVTRRAAAGSRSGIVRRNFTRFNATCPRSGGAVRQPS